MNTIKADVILLPTTDNNNPDDIIYQYHMYIVTDEELKEGDWCITHNPKKPIEQVSKDTYLPHVNKKKKIIATNNPNVLFKFGTISGGVIETNLPKPPKSFMDEYYKAGGIDTVNVELDIIEKYPYSPKFTIEKSIKVNSHNEITIHPIKQTWNRDEVEEIVNLYESLLYNNNDVATIQDMKKRIKEIMN